VTAASQSLVLFATGSRTGRSFVLISRLRNVRQHTNSIHGSRERDASLDVVGSESPRSKLSMILHPFCKLLSLCLEFCEPFMLLMSRVRHTRMSMKPTLFSRYWKGFGCPSRSILPAQVLQLTGFNGCEPSTNPKQDRKTAASVSICISSGNEAPVCTLLERVENSWAE
jgi:hypothetical protein